MIGRHLFGLSALRLAAPTEANLQLTISTREKGSLLLVALALTIASSSAQAGQGVSTSCWKRLSDGDIHADTRGRPELDSGFKVLRYKANRSSDGWSYGSCVLQPSH